MELAQEIWAACPFPIVVVDGQGLILAWSPGAEAVLGWTEQEALGQKLPSTRLRRLLDRVLSKGPRTEPLLLRHARTARPLRLTATAAPLADGRVILWMHDGQEEAATRLRRQLLQARENERRELALDLHDHVGQFLTTLGVQLQNCQRSVPASQNYLAPALALVGNLHRQVETLQLELRPAVLDELGVVPAVQALIHRLQEDVGLEVAFEHLPLVRYEPEVELAAYRVVQEALTNILRHSGVRQARVRVWSDGSLWIQVEDKGLGFAPSAPTALAGLRERVELAGGRFQVESAPGEGTRLTAEFRSPSTPGPA